MMSELTPGSTNSSGAMELEMSQGKSGLEWLEEKMKMKKLNPNSILLLNMSLLNHSKDCSVNLASLDNDLVDIRTQYSYNEYPVQS